MLQKRSIYTITWLSAVFFFITPLGGNAFAAAPVIMATAADGVVDGTRTTSGRIATYDFGEPFVITKIDYTASWSHMQLALFEGSNSPDFTDAIPIYIIKEEPTAGVPITADVSCSRGFRYVRYVAPRTNSTSFPRLTFYGHRGAGDDSHLYQVTNLPTVVIHTVGSKPVTSKTTYLPGIASIISENGTAFLTDSMEVRGRGNGTWTLEKKPYKIKFKNKHRVLNMPANAKKWTLLANHQDKSLMRNLVSFEVSRQIGMIYTPQGHPVDVIVNGEYMGNFDIYDQMEVKNNRIEVDRMTPEDNSRPNITGGYLLQLNGYAASDPVMFYSSNYNAPVTIHYPKDDKITMRQRTYIKSHYEEMERRIFSANPLDPETGISSYVDVESFIKRFVLEEATANADNNFSIYIMKYRNDDHMYFSPGWDFDHTYDIFSSCSPANQYDTYLSLAPPTSNIGSIKAIIRRVITNYNDMLVDLWNDLRFRRDLTYRHYEHFIDSLATLMDESQRLNFIRWPVLDVELPFGTGIRYTYKAEVNYLKTTLKERFAWMDEHVGLRYELGDVKVDGVSNLGDLMAAITFMAGRQDEMFVRKAADLNEDGLVNSKDIDLFIQQLVETDEQELVSPRTGTSLTASLSSPLADGECIVQISYDAQPVTACILEFDVTLPDGFTLENVEKSSGTARLLRTAVHQIADHTWRVFVYSHYCVELSADGPLADLKIKVADTVPVGSYDMKLTKVLGAAVDAVVTKFNDTTFSLPVGTDVGVRSVKSEKSDGRYYDLNGRRALPGQKGIILHNRRKYSVR